MSYKWTCASVAVLCGLASVGCVTSSEPGEGSSSNVEPASGITNAPAPRHYIEPLTPAPDIAKQFEAAPGMAETAQRGIVTAGGTCSTVVMNADSPASPSAVGTDVTLSATATCTGGTALYEFYMKPAGGTWSLLCPYSSSSTCTWTAPAFGTYYIQVGAKSSLSTASIDSHTAVETHQVGTPQTCSSVTLNPDSPASPSPVGTNVTLSATATCSGGTAEYEFWLQSGGTWSLLCPFSTSSTCTWSNPTAGDYKIQVGAKSSQSTANVDSSTPIEDHVIGQTGTCSSVVLNQDSPLSPSAPGTNVTLAATATCSAGTAEYEFYLKASGGSWQVLCPYSSSSTCTWTSPTVGTYSIQVEAKSSFSNNLYDSFSPPETHVIETQSADAGADSGSSDAGAGEAGPVVYPPSNWSLQEATAICEGVLGCCPGGLDAGIYDLASCEQTFTNIGWVTRTVPFDPSLYDAGHIGFNPDAGAACLAAMRNFPCGTQTAAYYKSTGDACYGTLYGLLATGSAGCRSSWECAPGNFCDSTVDGGLCSPLVGQGQSCATKAPRSEMCTYLGSDTQPFYCTFAEDPGKATCQPLLANGATCNNNDSQECTSEICGADNRCGDNQDAPVAAFCNSYVITDAGAD